MKRRNAFMRMKPGFLIQITKRAQACIAPQSAQALPLQLPGFGCSEAHSPGRYSAR